MSRGEEQRKARARRQARERKASQSQSQEAASVEIGVGGFLGSFLAVLVLGVALLGLWWWLMGPGSAVQRADPSGQGAAPVADTGALSSPRRVSAEIGADFTVDGEPVIGSDEAPVTIVEYSDYQCPNCRQFALEVMPWLKETWLRQGIVRVIYRDFAIRGEDSFRAATAAQCAAEQGRYWSYHDALFTAFSAEGASAYTTESLVALAASAGLSPERLAVCLADGSLRARVEATTNDAHQQGLEGTPTYFINGRQVAGAIEIADWEALFQAYAQELGVVAPAP
jgi:protein-disulfide isomerase